MHAPQSFHADSRHLQGGEDIDAARALGGIRHVVIASEDEDRAVARHPFHPVGELALHRRGGEASLVDVAGDQDQVYFLHPLDRRVQAAEEVGYAGIDAPVRVRTAVVFDTEVQVREV